MIKEGSKRNRIMLLMVVSCIILYIVEMVLAPSYGIKSICKIAIFIGSIMIFRYITNRSEHVLKGLFTIKDYKRTIVAGSIGIAVIGVILLGYYGFKDVIDFSNIVTNLQNKENISKENFIFVAIYICTVNAFLEEIFFRGFGFMILKKYTGFWAANIFSAVLFSVYHIAIISSWFNPFLFILMILGLVACGMIFNYLDHKYNSIIPSWIVHFSANVAINSIGIIMFDTVAK